MQNPYYPKKLISVIFCFLALQSLSGQAELTISGRVYYDVNKNNLFDASDSLPKQAKLEIRNANSIVKFPTTDSTGRYYFEGIRGSIYISLYQSSYSNDYRFVSSVSKTYASGGVDTINFALTLMDTVDYTNASTTILNSTIVKTGGDVLDFNIYYSFTGTAKSIPATLVLNIEPKFLFQITPKPSRLSAGVAEWDIDSIQRTVRNSLKVTLTTPEIDDSTSKIVVAPKLLPRIQLVKQPTITSSIKNVICTPTYNPIGPTKNVKWARTISYPLVGRKPFSEEIKAIDTSSDGKFIYAVGSQYVFTGYLAYLSKLTTDGLTVLEKNFEYPSFDEGYDSPFEPSICHTADGGFILAFSVKWLYPTIGGISLNKFDSLGNLVWNHFILNNFTKLGSKNVKVAKDGSIYLAYGGQTPGHPDSVAQSQSLDVVLHKLDGNGNEIWFKMYAGNKWDLVSAINIQQDGNLLIAGTTNSNSGDISYAGNMPLLSSTGIAFLLNVDGNGKQLWSKTFSLAENNFIGAIVPSNEGSWVLGSSEIYDTSTNTRNFPIWMRLFDHSGNVLRMFEFPSSSRYMLVRKSIGGASIDTAGNLVIAATTADRYSSIRSKHGADDIVLLKVSPDGIILFQTQIGGTGIDFVSDMILSSSNSIYFAGNSVSNDDDIYKNLNTEYGSKFIGEYGLANNIRGKVFLDGNGNQVLDAGEAIISEGVVVATSSDKVKEARFYNNEYLMNLQNGSYSLKFSSFKEYFKSTIEPVVAFSSIGNESIVNLPVIATGKKNDLSIRSFFIDIVRPGFDARLQVITANIGTEPVNNIITRINLPPSLSYQRSSRQPILISKDSIDFGISLNVGQADTIVLGLKVAPPPITNIGDTLAINSIVFPIENDNEPTDNRHILKAGVRGSYDPNDKSESHNGIYTPTMKAGNEPFQYLIRFQNTGNDTAFYVTVKDTLDKRLDLSSFQTISSSHPFEVTVDGNIANWRFSMIKLVDSTTNEPASHGHIAFTIKPKKELLIGDTIENKAAIYFDYNLPVITNSAMIIAVSDQSVICQGGATQLKAGVSGANYQWQIDNGDGFISIANTGVFKGSNTSVLSLTGVTSDYYGKEFRCAVITSRGVEYGPVYKITFRNAWTGAFSTAWENAANWSCGIVPDSFTDVIINSKAVRQPEITSNNAFCRSIQSTQFSRISVKAGAKLNITNK